DEFDQYYVKTKELYLSMVDAMLKLDDANVSIAEMVQSGILLSSLEMEKVVAKVDEFVSTMTFGESIDGADGALLTAKLSEAKALVSTAKTSLPEKLTTWMKALGSIEKTEFDINQFNASRGLAQLASSLTCQMLVNPQSRNQVLPVMQSVLSAGGKGGETHKDSAATIFKVVFETVSEYCRDPREVAPYMSIFMKLDESEWLDDDKKKQLSKVIEALKSWEQLVQHRSEWAALGADDRSRLMHANGGRVVKDLRGTTMAIDSTGVVGGIAGLVHDRKLAVDEIATAAETRKDIQNAALVLQPGQLKPFCVGTESSDRPWDENLEDGIGRPKVLQRVEETILLMGGTAFQEKIDRVKNAMLALTAKFAALLVHSYKTFSLQRPKLRRVVMSYKKEINDSGCTSSMRKGVLDW
ncbi:unnamed protein product, partial [Prorocentrum cordatum]